MSRESSFAWALVGPGRIAGRFAEAVTQLPGMHLAAVVGRDAARAAAFAARWPQGEEGALPRAGDDLAALLTDPAIDGVYVATPHAQHGAVVRACLQAGKAVLCEKSLVPTRAEAEPLAALARERRVFLMEALWTRFLPVYQRVGAWLREGRIGELRAIQSSFCFPAPYDPASRLFDPALAGGALLDVGVYSLSVTRWALQQQTPGGRCPEFEQLQVRGALAPTGVDLRFHATLDFPGGIVAQHYCALDASGDNALRLIGSRGHIVLPQRFWQATEARLQLHGEPEAEVASLPFAINGFEGEIEEAVRCVRAGLIESPHMPLDESLATLGWMDEIRRRLGVRYPFETEVA
ncbi:Gfo/Idh/MocA family oxidoreductase [Roseateles sp. DAIF2]|uniref:Gfo/Idh/MocA family protein n=1 Tax=Roseateles sp. DAIF2 TaxID=2714952 RepID=UPI0018A2762C|nr:Gfo/Idh/MocA family oxidoreductase [Roseateles sp. DAIF2]QPF72212.1 Gfo/Idh/MocA family oxidoreductase [Roseateles sp. DAIF2]